MASDIDFARTVLADARRMLTANTKGLTLNDAQFAGGAYRSILGLAKHIGGWGHVYHSYAFDAHPRHWPQTSWPRGLRDTVELTQDYLEEVLRWADDALAAWDETLAELGPGSLDEPRPTHWGGTLPLSIIVTIVAHHYVFHTGELNMLLSIKRGEAWEYSEEVEENHISTYGHGVPAPWMTEQQRRAHEETHRLAHEGRSAKRSTP